MLSSEHAITTLCRVLNVNRSTYYDFINHKPSNREKENQYIRSCILKIYAKSDKRLGVQKITFCLTDENDERHCHIFIKGCSKEDYDDFFRATGYIENTQETGTVTSVLPVCDSDECCKNYMVLTPILTVG